MSLLNRVIENKNILGGFSTRWGGVSKTPFNDFNLAFHVDDNKNDVRQNRKLLTRELEIESQNIAWMNQVHSDNIEIVEGGGEVMETDGIIAKQQDLALLVLVADCIPILFWDLKRKVVAVAHAGREGSYRNIAGKMIEKFKKEFNSNPTDIQVFLGPSIQKECYEVGEDIVEAFRNKWGEKYIYQKTNLDLPTLNKDQLLKEGVLSENISLSQICNHCDRNYFSYRREQKTGRFAGVVVLKI